MQNNLGQLIDGKDISRMSVNIVYPDAPEDATQHDIEMTTPVTDLFTGHQFKVGEYAKLKGPFSLASLLGGRKQYEVISFLSVEDPSLKLEISQLMGAWSRGVRLSYNRGNSAHMLQYTRTKMMAKVSSTLGTFHQTPTATPLQVQENIVRFLQQLGSPLYQPLQKLLAQNPNGVGVNQYNHS